MASLEAGLLELAWPRMFCMGHIVLGATLACNWQLDKAVLDPCKKKPSK